jgi:hypothetical protein
MAMIVTLIARCGCSERRVETIPVGATTGCCVRCGQGVEYVAPEGAGRVVEGADDLEEIDPADLLPVVFIPWDAPFTVSMTSGNGELDHECDELCDPPFGGDGHGPLEPVPDYGGVYDGAGTISSDADPGL